VKVIACIEDPVVIKRMLDHPKQKADANEPRPLPESRAPPTKQPPTRRCAVSPGRVASCREGEKRVIGKTQASSQTISAEFGARSG
jgi:hypothetical protein